MLVVEARERGRGRLLAVEPDVFDRGRAAQGAILTHSTYMNLRYCHQTSASDSAKIPAQQTLGVAHRTAFDQRDVL